jgi:hypothetical protein
MFQTKVVEKIKTHIECSNPPPPENRAVYEIMRKNMVERGRPHMTVWRMRIAVWIPKATNIHSEYVRINAFARQKWLHERASMLRYTYSACLVRLYTDICVIRAYDKAITIRQSTRC